MSGKGPTVRELYQELKTKRARLKSLSDQIKGKVEGAKEAVEEKVTLLQELGVKNPRDREQLKKHISESSKKLAKAIKEKIKEVDNGIAQLEQSGD